VASFLQLLDETNSGDYPAGTEELHLRGGKVHARVEYESGGAGRSTLAPQRLQAEWRAAARGCEKTPLDISPEC
jgi:hypothetical protein